MNTFLRFLKRNKLYTLINVFGLSISLAFVVLIAVYTERQMRTDAFQEKADRIYLLSCMKSQYPNGYWLPRHITPRFPEIESAVSLSPGKNCFRTNGEATQEDALFADSAFFHIFTTETVEGSTEQFALSDHNCVVSQSYARKMFGDRSAVGKTVTIENCNDSIPHTIVAVIKDIENSVLPDAAVILRGELLPRMNPSNDEHMSNAASSYTFVLAKENADLAAKLPDIKKFLMGMYWIMQYYPDDADVQLHPLRSLYFDEKLGEDLNRGDASMMRVLDLVALVLLFFAILNYINLTTAQATLRAKEMATRRLLGTSRKAVMMRLTGETIALCGVSFLVAVLLAECIAPYASEVVNYPLSVVRSITPAFVGVFVAAIVVLGTLSGIMPAVLISSYKPLDVMRGELGSRISGLYGYLMIGLQYTIVCVMLICGLMFYRQIRGMIEAPLGYRTADMILMGNDLEPAQLKVLKDKLKQEPWVENVGFTCGHPHTGLNNNTMQLEDGTALPFRMLYCDSATFDILGIKQLHDNHVSHSDSNHDDGVLCMYLTKSTYAKLGLKVNSDRPVITKHGGRIISKGTFADFHYGSMLESEQPPVWIDYLDMEHNYPWHTLIKTTGNHGENLKRLAALYAEINPGMPFDNAQYMDDIIYETYDRQHRVLTIVAVFAVISVIVASLGLLAMSTIYIRGHRRSIAVKRIFGIRPEQIVRELLRPFVIIVGISFVFACPLAYKLVNWWLADYTFRVPQVWWGYAAVGIAALLTAVLTVVGLAAKAARSNPVDCLRE